MKVIMMLSDRIEEEIADAKWYARHALKLKSKYRSLADTMYQLSLEEVRHAQMLHGEATTIINEYRSANGDPPELMMQLYDYVHDRMIASMNEAQTLQQMYNQ